MSNNIATKLQAILSAKGDIKDAIEGKGVTVGNASLDQYASKIEAIQGGDTDGLNGFLSVESKTIPTSASQTTNIAYNKNCGILDENYKKWDTLAWHQRWVDNGYSATGLSKPIGIWMNAFGLEIVFLWPLTSNVSYSDVSGTVTQLVDNVFVPMVYNSEPIKSATAADRTVWPANQSGNVGHGTAGKYNSATFRTVNNGDGLDMVCLNTGETFTIPSRDVGQSYGFRSDNYDDYFESHYKQCEFYRALFAICSGIAVPSGTSEGETTTVEILNASGQQPAVNEDMYFWIGGTNTNLKAKYNLNCIPRVAANVTTGLLTQTIADAIYAKQIAAGINMNDTGVNSSSKHILPEGSKGAEAIAVGDANNRYWYIKTPFISNPSSTSFSVLSNIPDAPAIYLCKKRGVVMNSDKRLWVYWLNRDTHITSLVNLLRTVEGLSNDVPERVGSETWSVIRGYTQTNILQVNTNVGILTSTTSNYRYSVIPTLPSSTQFAT